MIGSLHRFRAARLLAVTMMLVVGLTGILDSRAQQQGVPPKQEIAPRRGATRDAKSREELKKDREGAPKLGELLKEKAQEPRGPRPSTNTENTLLSRSIVLFDGEKCTLIPLGSILHLPEAHRSQVVSKPQGAFTAWPNFLKRNASWLAAKEVPLAMAKGDAKAAESVLREVAAEDHVVVSVYKGVPIMILEPAFVAEKQPATNEEKESKNAN